MTWGEGVHGGMLREKQATIIMNIELSTTAMESFTLDVCLFTTKRCSEPKVNKKRNKKQNSARRGSSPEALQKTPPYRYTTSTSCIQRPYCCCTGAVKDAVPRVSGFGRQLVNNNNRSYHAHTGRYSPATHHTNRAPERREVVAVEFPIIAPTV